MVVWMDINDVYFLLDFMSWNYNIYYKYLFHIILFKLFRLPNLNMWVSWISFILECDTTQASPMNLQLRSHMCSGISDYIFFLIDKGSIKGNKGSSTQETDKNTKPRETDKNTKPTFWNKEEEKCFKYKNYYKQQFYKKRKVKSKIYKL